jgi:hypothetical protein
MNVIVSAQITYPEDGGSAVAVPPKQFHIGQ